MMQVLAIYPAFHPAVNEMAMVWRLLCAGGEVSCTVVTGARDVLKGQSVGPPIETLPNLVIKRVEDSRTLPLLAAETARQRRPDIIFCAVARNMNSALSAQAVAHAPIVLHTEFFLEDRALLSRRDYLGVRALSGAIAAARRRTIRRQTKRILCSNPVEFRQKEALAWLLEVAFIQKFVLFLSHPLYAVAVALAGFLLFAGLGSRFAARLDRGQRGTAVRAAIGVIIATGMVYLLVLPALFPQWMGLPDAEKISVALVLIAPLAFPMGLPFPVGLARTHRLAPTLVPWAWGVNGCASVIAAVLATVLAMHWGFTAVVLIALALYGMAAILLPPDVG